MAPSGLVARLQSPPAFNQTALLFGALAFAFVFFVTVRGDLGKWLGLLGLAASTPAATTQGTPPAAPGVPGLPALPAIGAPAPPAANTPGGVGG